MNIKNISAPIENEINSGKNILSLGNLKFITDYKIEKKLILLDSKKSKLINNEIEYRGQIYLKPFDLDLNIFLKKFNINKFISKSDTYKELLYTKIPFNKNLSANIIIDAEKIVKNKLFDSGKFFLLLRQKNT